MDTAPTSSGSSTHASVQCSRWDLEAERQYREDTNLCRSALASGQQQGGDCKQQIGDNQQQEKTASSRASNREEMARSREETARGRLDLLRIA